MIIEVKVKLINDKRDFNDIPLTDERSFNSEIDQLFYLFDLAQLAQSEPAVDSIIWREFDKEWRQV